MSSAKDEAAIRALYQELMDSWNTGSGESFAAPFAEDGDLIGFDGTHLATFVGNHHTGHAHPFLGSRLSNAFASFESVNPFSASHFNSTPAR